MRVIRKIQKRKGTKPTRAKRDRTGEVKRSLPCCGKNPKNCDCRVPGKVVRAELNVVKQHFKDAPLISAADTTDVSVFQRLLGERLAEASLWFVFALAALHALFNQEDVWASFLLKQVVDFSNESVDFKALQMVLHSFLKKKKIIRSSNYYSVTLRKWRHGPLDTWQKVPKSRSARDALMARLVFASVPHPLWTLYEAAPSRDYWKAANVMFQSAVSDVSKGIMADYMHKCVLDRVFAVRDIDPGMISWWPLNCPAYVNGLGKIFGDSLSSEEDKFLALMYVYKQLRRVRSSSVPDTLAHLCWHMKDSR